MKVSGNSETSEIEIFELLGLDGTTSLVALDVDAARRKIVKLPWVESVEVRKIYPKTIEVKLKERQAYAIWQHGQELSLIERNGSVLRRFATTSFRRCHSLSAEMQKVLRLRSKASFRSGRTSRRA
ncbi:hypothetical protein AJ87_32430 [Rhizobium yanglingense]|nr:hypothetical protein AJ87_32430 [Rhizobium yanglingense]